MAVNAPTFRFPFALQGQPENVQQAHIFSFNAIQDIQQAIAALTAKIGSLQSTVTTITTIPAASSGSSTFATPYSILLVDSTIAVGGNVNVSGWDIVLCDMTSGAFTVTLPLSSSNGAIPIIVKKISNDLTPLVVLAQSTPTANFIDGLASVSIVLHNASLTFIADGGFAWEMV